MCATCGCSSESGVSITELPVGSAQSRNEAGDKRVLRIDHALGHAHDHAASHAQDHGHGPTHSHDDDTHPHAHDDAHPHAHDDTHPHAHDDTHPHAHDDAHPHAHDDAHPHAHDDANTHAHDHGHTHAHDDAHPHARDDTHPHARDDTHPHARDDTHPHARPHTHSRAHDHGHTHDYAHDHGRTHTHAHDDAHAHVRDHAPGGPGHVHHPVQARAPRMVELEQQVLAKNDAIAAQNRALLDRQQILALNVIGGPGAGKTTLLEHTLRRLGPSAPVSIIEGDQATLRDAERIRAAGAPVVQVNTGTGCHLDAAMVADSLRALRPQAGSLLVVENVGNLVCPALFDLGEHEKVVVLSVTEGEDKPLKYPHIFRAARLLLLNKIDLLPYVQFDVDRCIAHALRVNPRLEVIQLSATRGDGMDAWLTWVREARRQSASAPSPSSR